MDGSYEHIIIGGGLAGSISAYHLAERGPTLLLERDKVASGASGALSGLVNPFMARKANPVWEWKAALDAFDELISSTDLAHHYRQTGVLRPAAGLPQKLLFRDTAREHSDVCQWMQPGAVKERWPAVLADSGALFISRGGGVDMEPFVRGVGRAAEARGCELREHCPAKEFVKDGDAIVVKSAGGDFRGKKVIVCAGFGYSAWPQFRSLQVHPIKGQLVETPIPRDLSGDFPCLSGAGYIIRYEKRLVLGSTFRHTFEDLEPSNEDTEEIIRKTATLLPVVRVAPVKRKWTGVRITVPGTRLPIVGPLKDHPNLWVFTGLGSKGLLMSSLIGSKLPAYLDSPDQIPEAIRLA